MNSISSSIDRSRVLEASTTFIRSLGAYTLYFVLFVSIYLLVPEILSRVLFEESLLELPFDKLTFVVLTSTFGWLALLLDLSRLPSKNNLLTGAILLNTSMILLESVVLMFSRLYYSRPYLALFFFINTVVCFIAKEYADKRRHRRVAFLTPQPSLSANCDLGTEVQIKTDPRRSLQAVDLLLVDFRHPLPPEFGRAISGAALAGLPIMHVAQYLEEKEGRVSLEHVADNDFWTHWAPPGYLYVKRLLDIAIVLFVAPIALILCAMASVAVLITMGRPVVFKQERVSRRGSNFTIYKLRTMAPAPINASQNATMVGDQRITRVGAFLRRYRLDELPQLWNVLRGDMSVIGPRPEQPRLVEEYEREIPFFGLRHMVRPGISGWAQVKNGYAANAEESTSKLAYDLYYIKNLSLDMDLRIIARTMRTVLFGKGAR
jgi:lipopolysaccharide/colanic/teichoic acid biosynthesis glycosyltransferase